MIAAPLSLQAELGVGEPEENESPPVSVVSGGRVYLSNHSSQMDYASYRREGLPLMSSAVESKIKQINASDIAKFEERYAVEVLNEILAQPSDEPLNGVHARVETTTSSEIR